MGFIADFNLLSTVWEVKRLQPASKGFDAGNLMLTKSTDGQRCFNGFTVKQKWDLYQYEVSSTLIKSSMNHQN